MAPVPVATAVPETVTKAFGTVVVQMWSEAQALANTGLAAAEQDWASEKSRLPGETDEAVEAVGRQTTDTAAVQARLTEAETAIAAIAAQAEKDGAESRHQITGLTKVARDATTREQLTRMTAAEYKESEAIIDSFNWRCDNGDVLALLRTRAKHGIPRALFQ